jgi:hypothetical protein
MLTRFPRWVAFSAASAISLVSVLPQSAAAQTLASAAPASCSLNPSFAPLAQGTPNVVGNCLDNGSINSGNGNVEQHTTGGLLYWRKSDSVTAFTDGTTTWLSGPFGVQSRLNSDAPFDWENLGGSVATTGAALAGEVRTSVQADPPAGPHHCSRC